MSILLVVGTIFTLIKVACVVSLINEAERERGQVATLP